MSYNVLTRTAGQGYGGAVRRMLAGGKGDSGNTQNPQEKDNANGTDTHTHTHTQNSPALLCNPL